MKRSLLSIICAAMLGVAACVASDSIRVALVSCWPGEDVYELEGHAAIHISGRVGGRDMDVAVNYGLFDFGAPNFVYRFVKGETDYWCGAAPWQAFLASYRAQGRRVVEYPLLMDSVQAARLVDIVSSNLLPQNRVYRYNYVKDNCATRPLRAVELAIGDSILLPEPEYDGTPDRTFRDVMRRYHANYPWYQFGIDLALGPGIDYPLSSREKAFAPVVLAGQLAGARTAYGPLSSGPVVVNEGVDVVCGPTPWYASPLCAAWLVFALALFLTWRDLRRRRSSRWFDAALFAIYGVAGLLIAFLVFVSTHEATSPNWLLLWLNPLCLVVPACVWLKKCNMVVISYHFINFALILTMIAVWPFTGQDGNVAFIPLIAADLMRSAAYVIINRKYLRSA